LSKNATQRGFKSGAFQPFHIEPFDSPESPATLPRDDHLFEAVSSSDDGADATFQCLSFGEREMEREQAKGILVRAKEKAALIEREAYEAGFAQGEKDGFEMGAKKLDKMLDLTEETLKGMVSYKSEFIKLYEKEILHLIFHIAEKVVRGKVKIDHTVVRETILEAFNLVVDRSEVTIRISPEDIEYVKEIRAEFLDRIKDLKSITVESDPSVNPGGCFMETVFGHIDARLESQLDKIARAVEQTLEESHVGTLLGR
jgi:flagellar assembly protein FliH